MAEVTAKPRNPRSISAAEFLNIETGAVGVTPNKSHGFGLPQFHSTPGLAFGISRQDLIQTQGSVHASKSQQRKKKRSGGKDKSSSEKDPKRGGIGRHLESYLEPGSDTNTGLGAVKAQGAVQQQPTTLSETTEPKKSLLASRMGAMPYFRTDSPVIVKPLIIADSEMDSEDSDSESGSLKLLLA